MDKSFCARPDSILIDDLPKNVDGFNRDGGMGYLFPALHNTRHQDFKDNIENSDDITEWLISEFDKTIGAKNESN